MGLKLQVHLFVVGKLLGSFLGKCSGSIRSIVKHPELPVIASCGKYLKSQLASLYRDALRRRSVYI